jgi:hypothetical protein
MCNFYKRRLGEGLFHLTLHPVSPLYDHVRILAFEAVLPVAPVKPT